MKGMVAAMAACLLVPALALAQNPQRPQPTSSTSAQPARADTNNQSSRQNASTVSSSTGEVSGGNENVPAKAIAEQQDPKLIGSPAWWKTHATADGKPLH